jgi:GT2 family glycosyltransferase
VIDNGSRDGSADLVADRYPGVRLIRNSDNLGFSKASNQGIRASAAEYVLLLNSDTVVLPGSIDGVVGYLEAHPEAGIAGCKVLKPDGALDAACRRSFPTPANALYQRLGLTKLFPKSRRFGAYYLSYLDPDKTASIDCLMGAYMMIRRSVIDRIGLLDEDCFFYAEDIDYCYRARQAGWEVVYYPGATIIHHRGASTAKNRIKATTYFHKSMLVFYRKHEAPHRSRLINGLVYAGIALSYATALVWNKVTRPRHARPLSNLREFVGRQQPLGRSRYQATQPDDVDRTLVG